MNNFNPIIMLSVLGLFCASANALTLSECRSTAGQQVLPSFAVQDQDGLGTCYANVASILMQQALGAKAPLSYNSIALVSGVRYADPSRKSLNEVDFDGGLKNNLIGNGGFVCDAVAASKDVGVCRASNFSLDSQGTADTWQRQSETLLSYSNLIDRIADREKPMDESDWQRYRNQVASLMYDKRTTCAGSPDEILAQKLDTSMPRDILRRVQEDENTKAIFDKRLAQQPPLPASERAEQQRLSDYWKVKIEKLKALRDGVLEFTASPSNPDIKRWKLRPAYSAALQAKVAGYRKNLEATSQKTGIPGQDSFTELMKNVDNPFAVIMDTALSSGLQVDPEIVKDAHYDVRSRNTLINAYRGLLDCNNDVDASVAGSVDPAAISGEGCEGWAGASNPTMRAAYENAQDIVKKLRESAGGTLNARAVAALQVLAPRCVEEMMSTAEKLSKMNCEKVDLNNDPITGSKVAHSNSWISERLCQGKPVGISVCTNFMSVAGVVNTQNCTVGVEENGRTLHGYHAMTVVGQEIAADGKSSRYLVQNSWGKLCPFSDPKIAAQKNATCEMVNGEPTGRFWISDRTLLNNTYELSSVNNAP